MRLSGGYGNVYLLQFKSIETWMFISEQTLNWQEVLPMNVQHSENGVSIE
jgi:hypothetical protein